MSTTTHTPFTVGQRVRLTADSEIEPHAEGEVYCVRPKRYAMDDHVYGVKFDEASDINAIHGDVFMQGELEAVEGEEEEHDEPAEADAAEYLQAALDVIREYGHEPGDMKVVGSLASLGYLTRDTGFEVKFRGRSFLITIQRGRR